MPPWFKGHSLSYVDFDEQPPQNKLKKRPPKGTHLHMVDSSRAVCLHAPTALSGPPAALADPYAIRVSPGVQERMSRAPWVRKYDGYD